MNLVWISENREKSGLSRKLKVPALDIQIKRYGGENIGYGGENIGYGGENIAINIGSLNRMN